MNLYRIWRSGDDLLLVISYSGGKIELSRDEALALSAEIAGFYAEQPTRKPYKHLTTGERADICRLHEDGTGVSEIGRRFNREPSVIYSVLRKAGVPPRNPQTSERIRQLRAQRKAAA